MFLLHGFFGGHQIILQCWICNFLSCINIAFMTRSYGNVCILDHINILRLIHPTLIIYFSQAIFPFSFLIGNLSNFLPNDLSFFSWLKTYLICRTNMYLLLVVLLCFGMISWKYIHSWFFVLLCSQNFSNRILVFPCFFCS